MVMRIRMKDIKEVEFECLRGRVPQLRRPGCVRVEDGAVEAQRRNKAFRRVSQKANRGIRHIPKQSAQTVIFGLEI